MFTSKIFTDSSNVNGGGKIGVVGFGNAGVYVLLSTGSSFLKHELLHKAFGYNTGGWRVEKHPRTLARVNK